MSERSKIRTTYKIKYVMIRKEWSRRSLDWTGRLTYDPEYRVLRFWFRIKWGKGWVAVG